MQKIADFEQATLFMFILEKGIPEWAEGSEVKVFARLLNISEQDARTAFDRAVKAGFIDRQ